MREEIFQYVKKKYKTVPDYPFRTAPTYPVLRHVDTRKWFALIMDVPREKLGLKGTEYVDIINVKLGDPMLADMLVRQPGYFYGYHITRSDVDSDHDSSGQQSEYKRRCDQCYPFLHSLSYPPENHLCDISLFLFVMAMFYRSFMFKMCPNSQISVI